MLTLLKKMSPVLLLFFIVFLLVSCMEHLKRETRDEDIIHGVPVFINEKTETAMPQDQEPGDIPQEKESILDLSIEQAVSSVLTYNHDLKIQKLEPVKNGAFEKIERAAFDPEVFAEIVYAQEDILPDTQSEEEGVMTEDAKTASMGLRQIFPTGTEVEAVVSHERIEADDTQEDRETRIGLTLTQSLLNGFGLSMNLAKVKQAELDTIISLQELKGFTETLVGDTEIAYWQYVLANRKIAIFDQSLAIARTQRDEVEQQIAVGILPKTEAAAARSEVALREQDVIDARSLAEEKRLHLLQLIRPSGEGQFDLILNLTSKPEIDIMPVTDLSDRLKLAEKSRSDLNEARLRLEQNRLETRITKNGILPHLDFFINLGRTVYSDTFRNSDDTEADDFQVGLSLSHTIGNRQSRAENKAVWASRHQSRLAVQNLLSLIHLDVRLAVNEVRRAGKQVKATHATRIFQEQTYAAEKDRFDVGSSTALLVAQAQRDLMAARIAEVEAIVNFRIALIRLYLAEGSLIELRGIKIVTSAQG